MTTDLADKPERNRLVEILGRRLGSRYALATLANFQAYHPKQADVLARLAKFAENMPSLIGSGVLLFGAPGTGKDHLLAALLKIATAKWGYRVTWWDGVDLAAEFRSLMNENSRTTEREFIRELVRPHVLAISDPVPPRGELSTYQLSTLREVIDLRYRDRKPIWITTNIDKRDDADAALSVPLMDRLKEGAVSIYCDWPSYRAKQQPTW